MTVCEIPDWMATPGVVPEAASAQRSNPIEAAILSGPQDRGMRPPKARCDGSSPSPDANLAVEAHSDVRHSGKVEADGANPSNGSNLPCKHR